ncbi:uncharacterized protein [Miscanthus floridulus]|uniref:uncharacterized protein n=1 Tax=Miscanthus floridulus TaxID=154761 RepID=UPI003457EAFA
MSFSAAVQWWEDWQLRLLVLASLFFQYFLFVSAVVRKLRVPHWFRALIWLAYQGGDVVAIYALATLFSRHKEEALATNPANAHLETLWAPILLLHLGGQDGITAYSIEDNENWRRHLLVSVSQITIAIYVFRKSWWSAGDMILLRAAILLFVPGILKCLEKPWALKNAMVASIMNSSDSRLEEATLDEDDAQQKEKDINSQEKYVQAAAETVANPVTQPVEDDLAGQPYDLFVDRGHPYSIRLRNLGLVAPRSARAESADVHDLGRSALSKAFDRLYTKHKASFGGLLRAAVALVTFVVIGLFQRRHRGVYDRADVVVTYVLLCCTAALEFVSACLVLASGLPRPDDKLAQYNLVGYLARNEKHPWLWALARLLGARVLLDLLWCTAPPQLSPSITWLVYDHVAAGWKDYIWKSLYEQDAATGGWKRKPTLTDGVRAYRLFNDSRGQRTLEREGCVGRSAIEKSLRMPFDKSVLLWHLATEFCYFDHVDTGHDATRHSRMVSNYMAYLLFVEPEMLIPGARSKLFRATYHELRKMLKPPSEDELAETELEPTEKKAPPPRSENEIARKVIQKVKSTIGLGLGSENVVHKAWAVANELKEFAKEKKKEFIEKWKLRAVVRSAKKTFKEMAVEFIIEAKNFISEAEKFISEEKKKKQTKEEEKITDLLGSAKKKAEEFIKEEEKTEKEKEKEEERNKKQMVDDFSRSAQAVIKEINDQLEEETKKQKQLTKLVDRNLMTKEEELLKIRAREHADDKMWAVIRGVWVEMLCFSAGRCRGYLHAKSLGNGGEYLSYVWLLLSYMGMETMPERMRMQRPELPVVGDTRALVKTPTDEDVDDPVGEHNV